MNGMAAGVWLAAGVLAGPAAQLPGRGVEAPLWSGRAAINLVPAEYAIVAGSDSAERLDQAALAAGWRPAPAGPVVLPTREGSVEVRAYTAGEAWLLQGVTEGDRPVTVRARLDRAPVWAGAAGEAPGREPADSPRPAAGRRLLHVSGDGFEAACYRSAAPPESVLRDAARRLGRGGWRVAPLGGTGLLAARRGAPDLAWHVRPDGTGSLVLVLASEAPR